MCKLKTTAASVLLGALGTMTNGTEKQICEVPAEPSSPRNQKYVLTTAIYDTQRNHVNLKTENK